MAFDGDGGHDEHVADDRCQYDETEYDGSDEQVRQAVRRRQRRQRPTTFGRQDDAGMRRSVYVVDEVGCRSRMNTERLVCGKNK